VGGPEVVDGMTDVSCDCLAERSTASLPGMPQCPGVQIKTTLRWEGVRTRFKRISIRWTRGCVE